MSKQIRFEIMCVLQGDAFKGENSFGHEIGKDDSIGVANDVADKLSDFMEDELGIDCAIVVVDAEKEEEIEP